MEPIINVAKIPVERWNLKCILCRKMEGACIQCSEKSCLVAYHVTCAQHYKLYMQMNSNKIKGELNLLSYCPKHHRGQDGEPAQFTLSTPNKQRATFDGTSSPYRSPGVKSNSAVGRQDGSPKKFDQQKRKELEERFSEFASPDSVVKSLKGSVSKSLVSDVYLYWRLKRKHNHSKPLLTPKQEEDKFLKEHEEREYTRLIKILIALRQNLEKARNLCYMVVRANKLKYQYRKILEDQFELFSRATSRPDISKRDTVMLEKYLTPVPGRLNLYERVLMGREESVEEKIADGGDYRSESTDSGHDGPSPSLRLSAAEHFSTHSPDNKRNYSGKERIKRNGLSNHLFPVDGSMCISSKSGEELAFSPSRDRNFNLSPKPLLKKGDGQQNMGWNGKLNGLVTYGRGRKRKHWQSNGDKLEHSFSPMALNERSNFYSSVTRGSDSKRAKLRGSDKWSKTLRSKIKNT